MKKVFLFIVLSTLLGCKDELDLKPDSALIIPRTVTDLESILDNTSVMNVTPSLNQISADEYFIPTLSTWQAEAKPVSRNAYIWDKDIYMGQTQINSWCAPYTAIFYCNSVLHVLNEDNIGTREERDNLRGRALFTRAYSFYSLASTFCKAYNSSSSKTDLGIPLKLTANIDEVGQRESLENTYQQIIKDAEKASELAKQDITADKRNRPSKVAAFALLARVYLSMRDYDKAEINVDKVLNLYSILTDFNTLKTTGTSSFSYNTPEVIYFSQLFPEFIKATASVNVTYGIDTNLLKLYNPGDLRLKIYFQPNSLGNYNLKRINSIASAPFTGLATDEMYLIKAECLARRKQKDAAISILDMLIKSRMQNQLYVPSSAANSDEALDLVLNERRKALVWRSVRWTDLKRLNLENRNIILTRNLSGKIYRLEPNSPLYVMPIPSDEIALSGIKPNIR